MPTSAHDLKHQQIDDDLAAVYHLVRKLDERTRRHERRLDRIDQRLDGIDARLDGIDARLDVLTQLMDEVRQGLATVIDLVSRRPEAG